MEPIDIDYRVHRFIGLLTPGASSSQTGMQESLNTRADYLNGPMRRRSQKLRLRSDDESHSRLRHKRGCGDASKRFSCLTLVLATQPIPTGSEYIKILPREFWLILPEVTAIEVRLSHASRM